MTKYSNKDMIDKVQAGDEAATGVDFSAEAAKAKRDDAALRAGVEASDAPLTGPVGDSAPSTSGIEKGANESRLTHLDSRDDDDGAL